MYVCIHVAISDVYMCSIFLENVAMGMNATQSNTSATFHASKAVDGNTNTFFDQDSCSQTTSMDNPWLEVHLGETYYVYGVFLHNTESADHCE